MAKHLSQWTRAFLIQSSDLGEADRLLTFYTDREGKLRGVARGAKRSRKRFGGALDYFHLLRLRYRPSNGELCHLEDVEVLRRGGEFTGDLEIYARANYFLELLGLLTHPHEPDEKIFDMLAFTLGALEKNEPFASLGMLTSFFELNLLAYLGFRPHLSDCVLCHGSVASEKDFAFSMRSGGILCTSCAKAGDIEYQTHRLSAEGLGALQDLLLDERSMTPLSGVARKPCVAVEAEVRKVLRSLVSTHTPRPLKSAAFMHEVKALSV